jgi:subtilisin family serine protease
MTRAGRARCWAALLTLCGLADVAPAETPATDRLLGMVPASAPPGLAHDLAREHGLELLREWPLATLDLRCIEFAVDEAGLADEQLARLGRDPRVDAAQFSQWHRVAGAPLAMQPARVVTDPYFDLQMRTRRREVETILAQGSGRGVRIAVIDTGVDTNHPDLVGQLAEATNFVSGDPAMVPAEFHGTAVVGLIAARSGNGIGIHGLAPNAEIFALRACWEPSYAYGLCSTNTLAKALDHAIDMRAHIINLSLAGPDDALLARLVERAIELGAVVFGAVGDDPEQTFPTSIAHVIAVQQGIDDDMARATAGLNLTMAGLQVLSTVPDGRYDFVSGPSFATAHASGVAAVMLELEPRSRAADLVAWLRRAHAGGASL